MTKQEYVQLISDKIDAGDTFPATEENFHQCFYNKSGCKNQCFIGVLLPKDVYDVCSVDVLLSEKPVLKKYMPEGATKVQLKLCQELHDNYAYYAGLRRRHQKDQNACEYFKEKKEEILTRLKEILEI